ncbi:hypothetical protein tloyanaT_01120 [Thalassotalea loyana]|uniref:Glycosyltransferase subfamily 4-like N-terminal domain-containing protein n=1 Tax=Thalassotalea loyana TaxID=280483 RepID=A0ABQ6HAR4_9GAMM|nr:glycosyltransferase family 4 protein [Thalassotalea loyana]GLX83860.1 hypothetical protein tloyanaT_01120 [Thalassotalea loyana]
MKILRTKYAMGKNYQLNSVIHVVSSLEVGGAERFVIDLCQLQKKAGMSVAILSFGQETDPLVAECNAFNIDVFHTREGRIKKWRDAINALSSFDIVHFHTPYPVKFLLPFLPMLASKTLIYTRHGASPLAGLGWSVTHKVANFFIDHITFVSQEGAEIFTASHGWHKKTKHVIDNGVNLDQVQVSRKPTTFLRLGSVGRMVELKHQICLLRAIAMLAPEIREQVKVEFFGDGPCKSELTAFCQDEALDDLVTFHGMVSDRDVIYNSFDVLVVASETEGLSLAIMEAMAYECAVIATDVGGNSKLVQDQQNGYLFRYDDHETLASHIKSLIESPDRINEFASKSRGLIEEQFSLAVSSDKYQKIYQS